MTVPSVSALSLREKVGQLFVVGFEGTASPGHVPRLVEEWGLGGVIYFSRNVTTPRATRDLSDEIQALAADAGLPPLFVTTDQEGGVVSRLDWGTQIPGAMALSAAADETLTKEAGEATGAELRSLGVNFDLAPVLDVNVDPDNPVIGVRSFGDDPAQVARHGVAFAEGLRSTGVLACGKHFPGHGDTAQDSHHELPVVPHDRARLDVVELPPFRAAIDAGVAAIMTTHVAFPALTGDETTPATLSREAISGLLCDELGFDGLVVTDCLEMDAVADDVGTADAALRAVEAGCDLLTVSHSPERQVAAMRRVYEAVETGRLSETRLDRSVERILAAKRSRNLGGPPDADWQAAAERSRRTARQVAECAVSLVRDRADALPLSGRVAVLTFGDPEATVAESGPFDPGLLTGRLDDAGLSVRHAVVADDVPAVDPGESVVLATIGIDEEAASVVAGLQADPSAGDLVVLSLKGPYDLRAVPDVDCFLAGYDYTPATLEAAGGVLVGDRAATGILPVTVPLDGSAPR